MSELTIQLCVVFRGQFLLAPFHKAHKVNLRIIGLDIVVSWKSLFRQVEWLYQMRCHYDDQLCLSFLKLAASKQGTKNSSITVEASLEVTPGTIVPSISTALE